MKADYMKVIITLIFLSLFTIFVGDVMAQAATPLAAVGLPEKYGKRGRVQTITYADVPSVGAGDNETFKIPVPYDSGVVVEFTYVCASTNFDIWLSGSDNQTMRSPQTCIFKTDNNLEYSPTFEIPRYYFSGTDPQAEFMYLTISAPDIDTGIGSLIATYGKGGLE